MFSGDPHPGNFLRRPDGKVAFLDFGPFKQMEREPIELCLRIPRAVIEGDELELHHLLAGEGSLPDPSRFDPAELMSFMLDAYWCTKTDRRAWLQEADFSGASV